MFFVLYSALSFQRKLSFLLSQALNPLNVFFLVQGTRKPHGAKFFEIVTLARVARKTLGYDPTLIFSQLYYNTRLSVCLAIFD